MHVTYLSTRGETTDEQRNPDTVCPFPLFRYVKKKS